MTGLPSLTLGPLNLMFLALAAYDRAVGEALGRIHQDHGMSDWVQLTDESLMLARIVHAIVGGDFHERWCNRAYEVPVKRRDER